MSFINMSRCRLSVGDGVVNGTRLPDRHRQLWAVCPPYLINTGWGRMPVADVSILYFLMRLYRLGLLMFKSFAAFEILLLQSLKDLFHLLRLDLVYLFPQGDDPR